MAQQLQEAEGPAAGPVERLQRVLVGHHLLSPAHTRPPQLLGEGLRQLSHAAGVAARQVSEERVDVGRGRDVALRVALRRTHVQKPGLLSLQQLPSSTRIDDSRGAHCEYRSL